MTATALDKGKGKLIPDEPEESAGGPSPPVSEPESDDEITPEYLELLLERARQNAASSSGVRTGNNEEDVIPLDGSAEE